MTHGSVMHPTDVRLLDARTEFRPMQFTEPLTISGRSITWCTLAVVEVDVENRAGERATGRGASVLSVPWAWPAAQPSLEVRDAFLRRLTQRLLDEAAALPQADPIQLWHALDERLPVVSTAVHPAMPRLAALLPLGAIDNALHDAWGRAAERPVWTMYDAEHLNRDLAHLGMPGHYPGEFVRSPQSRMPVQHVVGATDPVAAAEGRRTLRDWLDEDGISHLKIKIASIDPGADAQRVAQIHEIAGEVNSAVRLTVDPNEGFAGAAALDTFLDRLAELSPAAVAALHFIEQPFPRSDQAPAELGRLAARVPILQDEGFTDVHALPTLGARGWSGIVIKASKGQSAALLAQAFAKAHGLVAVVQELPAIQEAFVHSARLTSRLDLTWTHLECSARQYVRSGFIRLRSSHPDLVSVRAGTVRLTPAESAGLY